jgi:hypothetical protein
MRLFRPNKTREKKQNMPESDSTQSIFQRLLRQKPDIQFYWDGVRIQNVSVQLRNIPLNLADGCTWLASAGLGILKMPFVFSETNQAPSYISTYFAALATNVTYQLDVLPSNMYAFSSLTSQILASCNVEPSNVNGNVYSLIAKWTVPLGNANGDVIFSRGFNETTNATIENCVETLVQNTINHGNVAAASMGGAVAGTCLLVASIFGSYKLLNHFCPAFKKMNTTDIEKNPLDHQSPKPQQASVTPQR